MKLPYTVACKLVDTDIVDVDVSDRDVRIEMISAVDDERVSAYLTPDDARKLRKALKLAIEAAEAAE